LPDSQLLCVISVNDFYKLQRNEKAGLETIKSTRILQKSNSEISSLESLELDFFYEEHENINSLHQSLQSELWKNYLDSAMEQAKRVEGQNLQAIHNQTIKLLNEKKQSPANGKVTEMLNPGLLSQRGSYWVFANFDLLKWDRQGNCDAFIFSSTTKIKDSLASQAVHALDVFKTFGLIIQNVFLRIPLRSNNDPSYENVSLGKKMKSHKRRLEQNLEYCDELIGKALSALKSEASLNPDGQELQLLEPHPNSINNRTNTNEKHYFALNSLFRGVGVINKLKDLGVKSLDDPKLKNPEAQSLLNAKHQLQLKTLHTKTTHIAKSELLGFIESLIDPVFSLDFESLHEVIPSAPEVKAWEHFPFMYSCSQILSQIDKEETISKYPFGKLDISRNGQTSNMKNKGNDLAIENLTGALSSQENSYFKTNLVCLHPSSNDWKGLAKQFLEDYKSAGSILVYNAQFERAMINCFARWLPESKTEFERIQNNLVDLQDVFFNFWFYDYRQAGRISLKTILPLLTDFNHKDGGIQDGGFASISYYYLRRPEYLPKNQVLFSHLKQPEEFVRNLFTYSALDAHGLLDIYLYIKKLVS
jgi:hypothetical protein